MNVLKTIKMNSKILMFMLLAYFLVNLSTARPQEDKPKSLGWKNTPDIGKKTLVTNQSIKIHPSVFGNFKVNPAVKSYPKNTAVPASPPPPAETSVPPAPITTPSAAKFQPSIKNTLPPSKVSAPTTVSTNENENHQGFGIVEDGGDDYEEEEEEEDEEEEEGEEEEEKDRLENSKTLTSQPMISSSTSKPTVPESVNQENDNHQGFGIVENEGDDYEDEGDDYEDEEEEEEKDGLENSKTVTSQPMISSLTSKPTVPESVNQENDNHQGFGIVENEGDDYEDEGDDYEDEEEEEEDGLENSKTVTSQPMISSLTSKPTVPESVNQENDNHQGFGIVEDGGDDYEDEGDDYEDEGDDYEDEEEEEDGLENSETVTSQPMLSSSISKPTEPESVNQENDIRQGFKVLKGGDDEEVLEENEYGHNVEDSSEDPNHNTPIDYITINGVQVNPSVPMNSFISTVPQLTEDELPENNYNESEYPLNTDEDHQVSYYYDELEPESSSFNNNPTEISETLNGKNDNTKDQPISSNEFELNSHDNTQISTDKQEDQFKNQYVTENKERIINGYKAMKKILYMLHDYASSTFNWIINKIDYRMDQVSS